MKLQALILSLLVLSVVQGRPQDNSVCDLSCQAGSEYFDYPVGESHLYTYQAVVENSFHDNAGAEQKSQLNMRAQVAVDIVSSCQHTLRITSASLTNSDQPGLDVTSWEQALTANQLDFTRENGAVKNLCASNGDPVWVLNIKRGILSSLSVSAVDVAEDQQVTESDILGDCVTTSYQVTSDRGSKQISKEKDLSRCVNANRPFGSFFSTLSAGSGQNTVKQTQQCTQYMNIYALQSSQCSEEHILRPFSNEDDGAATRITQTLTQTGTATAPYHTSARDTRHASLSFEDELPQENQQNIAEMQNLYEKICSTLDKETFEEVSQDYVKMIFLLRRLDSDAIAQTYSALNGACPKWENSLRSMFMDALKWCGSEGCVTYGAQLIAAGSDLFDEATSLQWLSAMNMIKEPTLAMVEAVTAILDSGRFQDQAYLTAGSLIHGVCAAESNCLRHYSIRNALRFFEDILGTNCYTPTQSGQNQILLALKGLGNAGQMNTESILAECAKEVRNSAEIRVVALEAYRRMSCGISRPLESLVFDREEDSEIRINAYLTLMKCPTNTFVSKIITMLDDEPSQQTASFVSTHLRALVSSTDPLKGYIKPYLLEAEFAKTYDMDPRKFSRYYEASYFSDVLNVGGTVEGGLIWSPRSFVPRSAMMNLTANVFGQAVNVFELGGRVEGVEQLLQDVMKPKKFLQDTGIGAIFGADDFADDDDDDDEEPEQPRKKVRIPNQNKLKEISKQYEKTMKQETLGASYFVRLFGNEISYANTQPKEVNQDISNQVSSFFTAVAEGQELSYHKNMAFATWAYTLPTGVGLPLTVAVNGSASLDVRVNGQMDFSSLLSTTPEFVVNTEVNPRATIVINGAMTVDAHVTESGIMTESSMTSGWKISGRASLSNGQRVNVRVDAPYQENSLFRFNHKLLKVAGDSRLPMTNDYVDSTTDCSAEFAGHALCLTKPVRDVSIFPQSGSLTYGLTIEKRDAALSHFILSAQYELQRDNSAVPASASVNVVFDTPGSDVNRRSEMTMNFVRDELRADASLVQPTGSSQVQGQISRSGNTMTVQATYTRDGDESNIRATLVNGLNEESPNFSLHSTLATPSGAYDFNTDFSYTPSEMISISSSLTNYYSISLGFSDQSARSKMVYQGNAELVVPGYYDNGIDFVATVKPGLDKFAAELEYTPKGQSQESIRVSHKHADTSAGDTTKWAAEEKLLMSAFADYNIVAKLDYLNNPQDLKSTAKIAWGADADSEDSCLQCIIVSQLFSFEGSTETSRQARGSFSITMPFNNFEESIGFTLTSEPRHTDAALQIRGADMFRFISNGDAENRDVKVMSPTPWGSVQLKATITEASDNLYQVEGSFGFGQSTGFEMTLSATVSNQDDQKMFALSVNGPQSELVSLKTDNRFLSPSGFSTENHFRTEFFPEITLNMLYQRPEEGGFDTSFHFDFAPILLGLQLNADPSENTAHAQIYYNDEQAQRQQLDASVEYTTTASQPEDTYLSGTVTLQSSIKQLPFSTASATGTVEYSGNEASVSGDITIDSNKLLGLEMTVQMSRQFRLDADVTQMLVPQMQRASVGLDLDLDQNTLRLSLGDGRGQVLAADATARDQSLQVNIQQQLTDAVPGRITGSFAYTASSVTISVGLDGNQVAFNGQLDSATQLVLTLTHQLPGLDRFGVPRSSQMDLQWGTRESDGKMGAWSTLTLNGQEAFIEALYGLQGNTHTVELTFNPNGAAALRSTSAFDVRGELELNENINFLYSMTVDGREKQTASFSYAGSTFALEFHQTQFDSAYVPSDIVANANWGSDSVLAAKMTLQGTETTLRGRASVRSSPVLADVVLAFSSNHPAVAGHYEATVGYDESDQNKASIQVTANDQEAQVELSYSLDDGFLDFKASQSFYQDTVNFPYIPYNTALQLQVDPTFRSCRVQLNYNTHYLYYTHEYSSEEFDFDFSCTVQQNLTPVGNDVKLQATLETFVPGSYDVKISGLAEIDDSGPQYAEVSYGKVGTDDVPKYTVSFSHTSSVLGEYWFIPSQLDAEVFYGSNTFGINIDKQGSLPATIALKADWNESGFIFTHEHNNAAIAELAGWEMFRFNTELRYEANRLSLSGDFAKDSSQPFSASAIIDWQINSSSNVEVSTDLQTNIFEILGFSDTIPTRVQTDTIFNVNIGQGGSFSGSATAKTLVRHSYSGLSDPLENTFDLEVEVQLFNYLVTITSEHDFETAVVPKFLKVDFGASASNAKSLMVYRSGHVTVTIDDLVQEAKMSFNYNPSENEVFLEVKQNVKQVLDYGIPGVMSVNFGGKSFTDLKLKVVYDTEEKSVGFVFDWDTENSKFMAEFNHDFDTLEDMGWPKKVGTEILAKMYTSDGTLNVLTIFGSDYRSLQSSFRWEGASMRSLREINYRHTQNFTNVAYFPKKFRVSLSIPDENLGFDAKLYFDNKELKAKVNLENQDGEYNWQFAFAQTLTKALYRRFQLYSTAVAEDNSLELKVKLDGRTKLTFEGRFNLDAREGTFSSSGLLEHKLKVSFPSSVNIQLDGSYRGEGAQLNVNTIIDEGSPNSFTLTTGRSSEDNFFAKFEHNMVDSSIPAQSRVDGTLLTNMGGIDLNLAFDRDGTENAVALHTSWQTNPMALFGQVSASHDFAELPQVPRHMEVKSFISGANQQAILDVNVTVDGELFQHMASADYYRSENRYKYGVSLKQDNRHLSALGVPQAAGVAGQLVYDRQRFDVQASINYENAPTEMRSSVSVLADMPRRDFSVRFMNTYSDGASATKDNQFGARVYANSFNPMIELRLQNAILQSLNVPRDYHVEIVNNNPDVVDWSVRGSADDQAVELRLQGDYQSSPFNLLAGVSAFHSISLLPQVPRNMSVQLIGKYGDEASGQVAVMYDRNSLEVGLNNRFASGKGQIEYYMYTNIPELGDVQRRDFKGTYAYRDMVLETTGVYTEDDNGVFDYSVTLNLNSGELAVVCQNTNINIVVDTMAFFGEISSEMTPISVNIELDDGPYALLVTSRPNGDEVVHTLQYSGGDITVESSLALGSSQSAFSRLTLQSSGCEWLPAHMILSYRSPMEVVAMWRQTDVKNLDMTVNQREIDLIVNDMTGALMGSVKGTYQQWEFDVAIQVPSVELDCQWSGELIPVDNNGVISVTTKYVDVPTNQAGKASLTAEVSGSRWSDIAVSFDLESTLEALPYNLDLDFEVAYQPKIKGYRFLLTSEGIGQKVVGTLLLGNAVFEMKLNVGPSEYGITGQRTPMQDSASIQWGSANDRLDISVDYTEINLKYTLTLNVEQPSAALGFNHFDASAEIDLTDSEYSVSLGGNLDQYNAKLVTSYEGAYPNIFGTHDVNFKLTWTEAVGVLKTQIANVKVELNDNLVNSQVSVQSDGQVLLSIVEEFSFSSDRYNALITMKQSLTDLIGLDYFSVSHSSKYTPDVITSDGTLQFNDLPESRYSGTFMKTLTDDSFNYSLSSDVSFGALSKWLYFRTITENGWYHQSGSVPSFSYTAMVDSDEYHISSKNSFLVSPRTDRVNFEMQLRQPHDIELFGMTLPKRNDLSMEYFRKKRGYRNILQYHNELLTYPIKMTNSFRTDTSETVLVDGSLAVTDSDDENTMFEVEYYLHKGGNEYEYTGSVDVNTPALPTKLNLVVSSINSEGQQGFDVVFNSGSTYRLKVTCQGSNMNILVEIPGQDPISLSGDVASIWAQAMAIVKRAWSESGGDGGVTFLRGITETENGFDMYAGLGNLFGGDYTVHLVVENDSPAASISVNVQENGVKTADLATVSVSLVGGRLVKLKMQANPVLGSLITSVVGIVESEVNNKIEWLADNIVDLLNTIAEALGGSAAVRAQIESNVRYLIAQIEAGRDSGVRMVSQASRSVSDLVSNEERGIQNLVHEKLVALLEKLENLNSMLLKPVQTIIDGYQSDVVANIKSLVLSNLESTRQLLNVINAGDLFIDLVEEAIEKGVSSLYIQADSFVLAIRGPARDLVTVTENEIVITLPLAFNYESFSITILPSTQEIKQWFEETSLSKKLNDVVQFAYGYLDTFYVVQAWYYTPLEEQIPPFKGHAFIADFKHYRTFDGRYYDFVSGCESSHVIATDGKNQNFTVTLTYGESPYYGVQFGSDLITFDADGSVTFNQNNRELPVTSPSGLVALRVGNSIKIKHGDDLSVSFDIQTKLLTINLSPFYFASTGGLLGLFDNEPNFDFASPDGQQLADVSDFAYAWEISDVKCSHENAYETSVDQRSQGACAALYQSSDSAFRACYPVVPADDFFTACTTSQRDFCKIAKAYQTTCTLKGALVSLPDSCLTCSDVTGKSLAGGKEKSYTVSSVDVVVIVQESECFSSKLKVLSKFMKKFSKSIISTFNSMKRKNTHFYMVGYGGPGGLNDAHTYTLRGGKIASNKKSDISKRIKHMSMSEDGTAADGMSAIMYASKLPFRAGAQQVFVHLMCDSCSHESAVSQSEISSVLAAKNIAYHHLPMKAIATKSKTNKQIYGYDNTKAMVKKSKNFNLNQIVSNADDACVPIATGSSGAVWDSSLMKAGDFAKILTNSLSRGLPSVGRQTCSCQMDEFGEVVSRCVY